MKQDIRPPTQHMSWHLLRLSGVPTRCLYQPQHYSPFARGCPNQSTSPTLIPYVHVYWPAVYSTSQNRLLKYIACLILTYIGPGYSTLGDRCLNSIAFLMHTYIGAAAYSTLEDRYLNGIACFNTQVCWHSYFRLYALLDIGFSTMLQIVGCFDRKGNS